MSEGLILPRPPTLGPPTSWFFAASSEVLDDPFEYYEELDPDRWSIRCVRKYRDGSLEAVSYECPNWRDVMPDAAVPPVEEVNRLSNFVAKDISRSEFESIWNLASASMELRRDRNA